MQPPGSGETTPGGTKPCPYCGRPILVKALQCVHCKRWMPELRRPPSPPQFEATEFSRGQPAAHLLVLSILTLGLYEFYWFHRNWRHFSEHLGRPLRPGWRTLGLLVPGLNIFLVYDQLRMIADAAGRAGVAVSYSPGVATAVFFALAFLSNLTMVWALSLLTVLPLLPVQETLNRFWVGQQPDRPMRREFTGAELLAMIAGVSMVAAALLGTLAG
ncbi:MAG: hypothetical protein D6760_01245 [Deltaproteobacteria bacterium]|nr:MAG: hypothetical protein D6760_01245 [Deltaproteobacteria bacterium]